MSKTYDEIYSSMKSGYETNTGFELDENSISARVLQALATELYGLYCYGDHISKQAFVQTATGDDLDKLAQLRGITRKQKAKAQGSLTFFLNEPKDTSVRIRSDVVCSVSSKPYLQFVTSEEAQIPAGETTVTVPAVAISEGARFNVYPNEIDNMVIAPVGVAGVYNEEAFMGGYDDENDESLRKRIIERYAFDPCGVNKRMLESCVKGLEFVTDCYIPYTETTGIIDVYVATKNGSLTAEQESDVISALDICRLVSTDINVKNSTLSDFSISVRLRVRKNCNRQLVEENLMALINDIYADCNIGSAFELDKIEKRSLLIDGVLDATVYSPQAMGNTVYCGFDEKLNISDVAVSYYEA